MSRTRFPPNTPVDGLDQALDELRAEAASRAAVQARGGVISGLAVEVGSVSTAVTLRAGTAMTPGGIRMALGSDLVNLPLASATLGARNYVCLFLTREVSRSRGTIGIGRILTTEYDDIVTAAVLSEAAFNALPSTSLDETVRTLDRAVVRAIVTARGPGAALVAADIQTVLAPTETVRTVSGLTIPGAVVVAASTTNALGTGTVTFDPVGNRWRWQAPTDGSAGSYVNTSTAGEYTLTSTNGATLTLFIDPALYGLVVGSGSTVTQTLTIAEFASPAVAAASAIDREHRAQRGGVIPTASNPHGVDGREHGRLVRQRGSRIIGEDITGVGQGAILRDLLRLSADPHTAWAGWSGVEVNAAANEVTFAVNARKNGTLWSLIDSGNPAYALRVRTASPSGVTIQYKGSLVTPWADNAWDVTTQVNNQGMSTPGVFLPAVQNVQLTAAQTTYTWFGPEVSSWPSANSEVRRSVGDPGSIANADRIETPSNVTAAAELATALKLPHGNTLTNVRYQVSNNGGNTRFAVWRQALATGVWERLHASEVNPGALALADSGTAYDLACTTNNVIDNENYRYVAVTRVLTGGQIFFFGVRTTTTQTTLNPPG